MLEAFIQIFLNVNLSLNQTLLKFLLYVKLYGYLRLIRKDSTTDMHYLPLYVKEGLPVAWELSLKNHTHVKKVGHTLELFWHLLMNLKKIIKKLLQWTNKKCRSFNTHLFFIRNLFI